MTGDGVFVLSKVVRPTGFKGIFRTTDPFIHLTPLFSLHSSILGDAVHKQQSSHRNQSHANMCQIEKNSPAAMIRTGFWDAPRREEQSLEDINLLFFLLTSPDRSPIGIIEINWRITAARIKWDISQLRTVIDRLAEQNEIIKSEGWIFITSWWDHNSLPGDGLIDRIVPVLEHAPPGLLKLWAKATWEQSKNKETWIFKHKLFDSYRNDPDLADGTGKGDTSRRSGGSRGGTTPPQSKRKTTVKKKDND